MKKQALIIFGEYRTFETASKFWNIPDNFDIFISTWDLSTEKRCCWVEFDKLINDWKIKTIPYFNPKNLDLSNFTENSNEYFLPKDNKHQISFEYKEWITQEMFSSLNPKSCRIHSWKKANKDYTTACMIYHWKHALDDVLTSNNWDSYENIFMIRMDSALIAPHNHKSMFELESLYNLNNNTIYTNSPSDLSNGTFFNDIWMYGTKESMKTWIQYLDIEKHKTSHTGLAVATKELVDKKILKHKNPSNGGLTTKFIRRGISEMWEVHYDKWVENNYHNKYLPIHHPNYSAFENAVNIQYE